MIEPIVEILALLALFLIISAVIMLGIYWCHRPYGRRKKCLRKK